MLMELTAIIKNGEKQYVALCPELDVVSQGYTVEESLMVQKTIIDPPPVFLLLHSTSI